MVRTIWTLQESSELNWLKFGQGPCKQNYNLFKRVADDLLEQSVSILDEALERAQIMQLFASSPCNNFKLQENATDAQAYKDIREKAVEVMDQLLDEIINFIFDQGMKYF